MYFTYNRIHAFKVFNSLVLQDYTTITTVNFRTFFTTQSFHSPSPSQLFNLLSVSIEICVFWTSLKVELYNLWSLVTGLTSLPCCSMYQYFIPFCGQIIFYSMDNTTFCFHCSVDGHLSCFCLLAIMNSDGVNICIQVFVCTYIFISLMRVYT